MRSRRFVLAVLLLVVVATTGCGFRRSSYRRSCDPGPALLPVMAVPVAANCNPCCPP